MARMSRRETILIFGLVVPLSAALVTMVVGPQFLAPLPTWTKLAIAAAGLCVIAVVALYARRRTRRT
jgi:hypothetical protein